MSTDSSVSNSVRSSENWNLLSAMRDLRGASTKFSLTNHTRNMFAVLFTAILLLSFSQVNAQEIMPNFATLPTGWTVDRYEPASFSNVGIYQGRPNVLGIGIDATTRAAARGAQSSTFYNTQGRKYTFSPVAGPGSVLSGMLYIPASWANESNGAVRTDMWGTMEDATSAISAYPIIGFTNYNGGGRLRVWDDDIGWVNLVTPVPYDSWVQFGIKLNPDSSFKFYVNGTEVYTDSSTGSSVAFREVIMQAYNFEDAALPPPAPLSVAPYTAYWSNISPTVVTVNSAALNGWVLASENTAGGSGSFVHGPGTPPNGVGSARLQIPSNVNGFILAREGFTGTRLDQLTSLSYSTYRTAGGPALAPSFFLTVDNDLTDADTGFKGRLTYEPYHTETVNTGVWQTWTPSTATGNWWFSNGTLATTSGCTMAAPCSFAEVLTAFPNAGFRNMPGSPMGFKVGSGWVGGFDGNVDSFLIGINSQQTLFDFEADPVTRVVDDNLTECPSAGFTSISAAIAAAFSGDIIQVCPGTYNESPQINKSLTLQSTGGRDVTTIQLLPSGTPGSPYTGALHVDNAAADVTIDGFTIIGNDAVGSGLANSNVLVRTANSVTLTNSRIRIGATGSGANGDDGIGIVNYYGLPTNSITVTNTEFSPLTTQGYRAFYANPGVENFVFQNNQVTGHFIRRHITEARTSNVSNNVVTGAGPGTGSPAGGLGVDNYLNYYPDQTATFTGNTVSNVSAGLWIGYYSAVSNVTATGNSFVNNQYGVSVFAGSTNVTLNYNRIAGNTIAGVRNNAASFNAENNWWGCNYGPAVAGVGCPVTPNGVVGAVDSSPWLTLTTAASPDLVIMPATSTVTSKLVWNSGGVDTAGMGTVPNTTPVAFAGTNGSVSPTNTTLTSGVATTTFTPTTPGAGNVATTVDGQTTDAPITVLATCATISVPVGTETLTGAQVVVPVNTTDVTSRGVLSADLTITFDPSVITPSAAGPFYGVTVGSVGSSGGSPVLTVNNPTPGTLVISVYSSGPWSGSGPVVNLSFTANGLPGTSSPVNITAARYNYDTPCVNTANGSVNVISGTISGVVSYANAKLPGPGFRPVPNTTLNAVGSINQSANSAFVTGAYSLSGMGAGAYTVTPSKSGDVNGILSNDAALIAQHVVGLTTLDAAQLKAAKVAGNPILTSYDAALISRYIVLLPGSGSTGNWVFDPINRSYPTVYTNQTNQDYAGTLMGDVDGNWAAPVSLSGLYERPYTPRQKPISVELPEVRTQNDTEFNMPVVVGDVTERGILGYQFDVEYDPAVIEPLETGIDRAETMSGEYAIATNVVEPGMLKVVLYGVTPLTGEGTLANLRFRAIGAEGSASAVRILNFIWHDGSIPAEVKDGAVEIRAEAAGNSIGGLVLTSTGEFISGARITITDINGDTRSAISNAFGNYRFEGLSVGQTYNVSVQSKRYAFTPVTVSVSNEPLSRLDLIANP